MSSHGLKTPHHRPGITAWDVERFTEGDCHFLARAIHLRTGWPMVAFDYRGMPSLHVFVLIPNGRVLDVQGVCSKAAMARRWQTKMGIAAFPWAELRKFGTPEFGPSTYRRAHVVAERLLARMPEGTGP